MSLENNDVSTPDAAATETVEQEMKKVVQIRKDVLIAIGVAVALLFVVLANGRSGRSSSDPTSTTVAASSNPAMEEIASLINNKQYDEGIVRLKEVIATDPKNALAFYNLGVAYQFTNRLEEADANYTLGLSIDNQNPSAYYNRGLVRRDLGRLDDAAKDLQIAVALKDNWAAAKFNYGQVLVSLGKKEEGNKQIEEARKIAPEIGK